MQNLTQMLMQKWGRTAVRQATNRHALLLTTSAMMAMLLVGCGGSDDSSDDPVVEQNHAPVVVHDAYELSVLYNDDNEYVITIRATDVDGDTVTVSFTDLDDSSLMHGDNFVSLGVPITMIKGESHQYSLTLVHSEEDTAPPIENIINTMTFHVYDGEVDSESATYKLIIEAPSVEPTISLQDLVDAIGNTDEGAYLPGFPKNDVVDLIGLQNSLSFTDKDGDTVTVIFSIENGDVMIATNIIDGSTAEQYAYIIKLEWNALGEITLDLIEDEVVDDVDDFQFAYGDYNNPVSIVDLYEQLRVGNPVEMTYASGESVTLTPLLMPMTENDLYYLTTIDEAVYQDETLETLVMQDYHEILFMRATSEAILEFDDIDLVASYVSHLNSDGDSDGETVAIEVGPQNNQGVNSIVYEDGGWLLVKTAVDAGSEEAYISNSVYFQTEAILDNLLSAGLPYTPTDDGPDIIFKSEVVSFLSAGSLSTTFLLSPSDEVYPDMPVFSEDTWVSLTLDLEDNGEITLSVDISQGYVTLDSSDIILIWANIGGTDLLVDYEVSDADEEVDLNDAEAVLAAVVDGDSKESFDAAINNNGESIGFSIENSDGSYAVVYVSRDHSMDVLSASYNDDKIAWYENDGSDNFTEHAISTAATGALSVYAADVDGDGDMDVLSASSDDNTIAWYENEGDGIFTKYVITTDAQGPISVYAADVDGDEDMDVLSASFDDNTIAWYENEGDGIFTKYAITTDAQGAYSVYAADVDGDGDMDVLSASPFDDKIAWYENEGYDQTSEQIIFTTHSISTSAIGARSVVAADVDGDGDMDVLSASYNDDTIAWHENEGGGIFSAEEHDISTTAYGAASVYAADVDGDGDMDVLSASFSDDTIAWYVNDVGNDGNVIFIEKIIISEIAIGARSVVAADVDGDGDMDVLSASSYDDKIDWYENDGDESFTTHSISTLVDGAYSVYAFENDNNYILDVEILNAGGDPLGGYVDNVNWYDIA